MLELGLKLLIAYLLGTLLGSLILGRLRGVDIRSKREIYRLLRDYVEAGNVAIMFCTEVLEVYEAADRAYVVADGVLSPATAVREYDHIE